MDKQIYQGELHRLADLMNNVDNTPFSIFVKALTLIILNMRYEKIAFNSNLIEHPYLLTKEIIADAILRFQSFMDISFIEGGSRDIGILKSQVKEEKHQRLFNKIWNKYNDVDFQRYIERYIHRIRVNRLEDLIYGKECVDLGCGNGNFCFALLGCGAAFVVGVDFGENSIAFAKEYSRIKNIENRSRFYHTTVYNTGLEDNRFDFAIQNGVFHHLEDENSAIEEVRRILKKGGYFWYYTTGGGSISRELWDTSANILKDIPTEFIESILESMNINRNKIVHLTDGLNATYTATSWEEITARLSSYGFGNFRRLTGGFDTDFDLDRIEKDPYGREKFGEGDLRILAQLLFK